MGAVLGLVLFFLGVLVSLTVVGAIVGIPLMILRIWLVLRGLFYEAGWEMGARLEVALCLFGRPGMTRGNRAVTCRGLEAHGGFVWQN